MIEYKLLLLILYLIYNTSISNTIYIISTPSTTQELLIQDCKDHSLYRTWLCTLEGSGRLRLSLLFVACVRCSVGECRVGRDRSFWEICRFRQIRRKVYEHYGPTELLLRYLLYWE